MNPFQIINKYYTEGSDLWNILATHSRAVADFALKIASNHPELPLNLKFIEEAAMLHDIGVFLTDAPGIKCHGNHNYICHGYLGREILDEEGFTEHALVCERHTGVGLSIEDIINQNLPVPLREMVPVTEEEQLICFADTFFSKSGDLTKAKPVEKVIKNLRRHGDHLVPKFNYWCERYL